MNWKELKDNPKTKEIYDKKLLILKKTREFFWSLGFVEAQTPLAVKTASQEPYLDPIGIRYIHPIGQEYPFYLHTSPEYALKKLLCAGYEKIFEICPCFRNREDFGGTHNPEFIMIEWYRSPGKLTDIMDDLESLFKSIGQTLNQDFVSRNEKKIPVNTIWDRVQMKEIWQKYLGVNLDEYLTIEKMSILAKEKGYQVEEKEKYEDLFYKIFLNEIEPKLGWKKPIIIYDYPAQMTSLSQLCEDGRYAERFECYIAGLELCNAFGELTDAQKQRENLEKDRKLRQELGKEVFPVDSEFIEALQSGMKPTGGIALGLDRMIMLFTSAKDINDVIFMSAKDQVENI